MTNLLSSICVLFTKVIIPYQITLALALSVYYTCRFPLRKVVFEIAADY